MTQQVSAKLTPDFPHLAAYRYNETQAIILHSPRRRIFVRAASQTA